MNLEKLNEILKKLKGVYKITNDFKQKERVKKEMKEVKMQINNLKRYGEEEVLQEDEQQEEIVVKIIAPSKSKKKENKILSKFPVKKIHPNCNDNEVNSAISYINVFEEELLGALSDFHLKLDYYHSRERDKFYNSFEHLKRLIKQYIDILEESSEASISSYIEKLNLMKNKQARALLIDSVKFINDISIFIEELIQDYEKKDNIVLNPEDEIVFSNIEGKRLLNNWFIIDALRYIYDFCKEFIDSIDMPDEILSLNNS